MSETPGARTREVTSGVNCGSLDDMSVMLKGLTPTLVTPRATDLSSLRVTLPNLRSLRERTRPGGIPNPLTVTELGLPGRLCVKFRVPDWAPVPMGVKVMPTT